MTTDNDGHNLGSIDDLMRPFRRTSVQAAVQPAQRMIDEYMVNNRVSLINQHGTDPQDMANALAIALAGSIGYTASGSGFVAKLGGAQAHSQYISALQQGDLDGAVNVIKQAAQNSDLTEHQTTSTDNVQNRPFETRLQIAQDYQNRWSSVQEVQERSLSDIAENIGNALATGAQAQDVLNQGSRPVGNDLQRLYRNSLGIPNPG